MIDEKLAHLRTHRNNISRYRRLLKTNLTELEREYIEHRLSDEQLALETLIGSTFPSPLRTTLRQPLCRGRHRPRATIPKFGASKSRDRLAGMCRAAPAPVAWLQDGLSFPPLGPFLLIGMQPSLRVHRLMIGGEHSGSSAHRRQPSCKGEQVPGFRAMDRRPGNGPTHIATDRGT
jgi:hypothetical protein